MISAKKYFSRIYSTLNALFGRSITMTFAIIALAVVAVTASTILFFNSAPPSSLTIASGPEGSSFRRTAEKYQKILKKQGVTLNIVATQGSSDNLRMLLDRKAKVDIGFVLGGEANASDIDKLMSLGSISNQPLFVFYRGAQKSLLSDFKGMRLYTGAEGSGARRLALSLLTVNELEFGKDVILVDIATKDSAAALLDGRIDGLFAMGESTSTVLMRQLLRAPEIHLLSFTQADAYARKITYLSKLELPMGSFDLGLNIPAEDISLVAPTVEILARPELHPALSDILLEAAREVHGSAGLLRKRGEFPAPLEHDFRISPDASRWYTSGKSFLYRTFPFGLASLISRLLAFIVPILLILVPALKLAPGIYSWRIRWRIYRWYGELLKLERDVFDHTVDANKKIELLKQLDLIDKAVNRIKIPAAFADMFYALRGHIDFVRRKLQDVEQ